MNATLHRLNNSVFLEVNKIEGKYNNPRLPRVLLRTNNNYGLIEEFTINETYLHIKSEFDKMQENINKNGKEYCVKTLDTVKQNVARVDMMLLILKIESTFTKKLREKNVTIEDMPLIMEMTYDKTGYLNAPGSTRLL